MTITEDAASMMPAASSGAVLRMVRCSATAAADCCTVPNAPNSTLVNERFMARHMMIDRIRPDEPSRAPAVISRLF